VAKSLIDDIEKCTLLYEKFADTKIVAKKLKISESYVKKYIKFSKLHKSIQDILFEPSIRGLTQKQTISILVRISDFLNYTHENVLDEKFMEFYNKFLEIEYDDEMKRQHAKRIGKQNRGKLCPNCKSTKQAIQHDVIKEIENIVLDTAFELEHGKEPDLIPRWTCVDCKHEWMGGMTIL